MHNDSGGLDIVDFGGPAIVVAAWQHYRHTKSQPGRIKACAFPGCISGQ